MSSGTKYMTAAEIARSYREARNKSEQVKILADLNVTTPEHICEILRGEGIEPYRRRKQATRCRMPKERHPAQGTGGCTPCQWREERACFEEAAQFSAAKAAGNCPAATVCEEQAPQATTQTEQTREEKTEMKKQKTTTEPTEQTAPMPGMTARQLSETMKDISEVFPEASVEGSGTGIGGVELTVRWNAEGDIACASVRLAGTT